MADMADIADIADTAEKGAGIESAAISKFCTPANAPDLGPKFSTVIKVEDLDGWVRFCDGKEAVTRIVGGEGGRGGKGRWVNAENDGDSDDSQDSQNSEED
jgi:hypothetical protein